MDVSVTSEVGELMATTPSCSWIVSPGVNFEVMQAEWHDAVTFQECIDPGQLGAAESHAPIAAPVTDVAFDATRMHLVSSRSHRVELLGFVGLRSPGLWLMCLRGSAKLRLR